MTLIIVIISQMVPSLSYFPPPPLKLVDLEKKNPYQFSMAEKKWVPIGETQSLKTSAGSCKNKDILHIFGAETEDKSSSLLNLGGQQEEEMMQGHETARVMEWMKECEEPVLL